MEGFISYLGRPRLRSERATDASRERGVSKGHIISSRDGRRAEQKENERHIGLEDAMRQKSKQSELPLRYRGEALNDRRSVEASTAADEDERSRKGYDPPD